MSNILTNNLKDFTSKDLKELAKIFKYYSENKTTTIVNDYFITGENIEYFKNKNSGSIFLSDIDYNAILINPKKNKLDLWLNSPYYGIEGFLSTELINDIFHKENFDDIEFLMNYKSYLNKTELKLFNKRLKEYHDINGYE